MKELKIEAILNLPQDKQKIIDFYEQYDIKLDTIRKIKTTQFSPSMQDVNSFLLKDRTYQSILGIPKKKIITFLPFGIFDNKVDFLNSKFRFLSVLKRSFDESPLERAFKEFQEKQGDVLRLDKQHANYLTNPDLELAHRSLAIDLQTKYINESTIKTIDYLYSNNKNKIKKSWFTKLDEYVRFSHKELENRKEENILDYKNKNKYILQYIISPENDFITINELKIYKNYISNEVLDSNKLGIVTPVDSIIIGKKIPKDEFFNSTLQKEKKIMKGVNNKKELLNELREIEKNKFFKLKDILKSYSTCR